MTEREKLARELQQLYFNSEYYAIEEELWLEISDHVLKREIEARVAELKGLQGNAEENGMFRRWEMLRKRISELEKQYNAITLWNTRHVDLEGLLSVDELTEIIESVAKVYHIEHHRFPCPQEFASEIYRAQQKKMNSQPPAYS